MKMFIGVGAAAIMLASLTACGTPQVIVQGKAESTTEAPAPSPEQRTDALVESAEDLSIKLAVETYRDQYPDDPITEEQLLAEADVICGEFAANLDGGGSFGAYMVDKALTVDDSERFGFMLGFALMAACPELTEHPNYSGS